MEPTVVKVGRVVSPVSESQWDSQEKVWGTGGTKDCP